jgi:hypothetical protein
VAGTDKAVAAASVSFVVSVLGWHPHQEKNVASSTVRIQVFNIYWFGLALKDFNLIIKRFNGS